MSEKLGLPYEELSKSIWGDFYLSSKGGQRTIVKGARDKGKNPLFVTLVLDNLYQLYWKAQPLEAEFETLTKICSSLNISVSEQVLKSTTKDRFLKICSSWLPLSKAVLDMIVDYVPAPTQLSLNRAELLLSTATTNVDSLPKNSRDLTAALMDCSSGPEVPLVGDIINFF